MNTSLIAFTPDIILFFAGTSLILAALAIRMFSSHTQKNNRIASTLAAFGLAMILLGIPIFLVRAANAINVA